MRFIKIADLKNGMRIARPIYNKKGVLLYDRDSKLTEQAISSISNFGLIGLYVLEPAEPLPPMTEEDMEFERFQTVKCFEIRDEIKEIIATHRSHKIDSITASIEKTYGHLHHPINFTQNIRSKEDFVFKHSLNVAILAAMMCNKMNATVRDTNDCIMACLLHDIGKITIPDMLLVDEEPEEIERIYENSVDTGFELIETVFSTNQNIKRICAQTHSILLSKKYGRPRENMKILLGTRVLLVAETFDTLTAIDATGSREPQSYVEALRYLMDAPDVFNKKAIEALVDSISILGPGTSVLLSNGKTALVVNPNAGNILYPLVLEFSSNEMIDLSNREMFGDLYIVDVVKKMDNRYVMSNGDKS